MVSPCCAAPADYQYATWHRCRACGRGFEMDPPRLAVARSAVGDVLPHIWPAKGHATRGFKTELAGGEESPEPKALL